MNPEFSDANKTVDRNEHLNWCKQRAREYLDAGDHRNAFASLASDLKKHAKTKDHRAMQLGMSLLIGGQLDNVPDMRKFIEGIS